MTHTAECAAQAAAAKTAYDAYVAQYPNYCVFCGGTGGIAYSGNFYEPPGEDPCDACDGECPRCRWTSAPEVYDAFIEGTNACPQCGFTMREPEPCPPGPECSCPIEWGDDAWS